MKAVEIKGPAKLFRVTSPSNGAMGEFWMTEAVWNEIRKSPDPKAVWRKHCAVWPDWNADGQFVVLETPHGQSLKVWQGPAASQAKPRGVNLDAHLEGGWDQVIVKVEKGQCDASRIDEVSGAGGQKTLKDKSMIAYWQEYGCRFPRRPRFRVRTDVVGETGKLPPRTGVYVPQDDPYGTLQFAWTGNSDGILSKVQTYNDAGLAAVKAMGRNAIWQDEQKMMAYVIEALKQGRLQPANGRDWKDVARLNTACVILFPQAFTARPCKWYFVEMIDGEFDDATEDETAIEPQHRPNIPAGSPCPESGWWFTPAQSGSRRYFKHGAVMPALGSDYGDTYWQWSPDQSAPTL